MITLSKTVLAEAATRISPYIVKTPVQEAKNLNDATGAELYFKMESLMPEVHAFKIRGALNAILSLNQSEQQRGVVTHSSGNHGLAVAYAAKMLNIPAHVVVPSNAPQVKLKNIHAQGAAVTICNPTQESRETTTEFIRQKSGMSFIHPFNNERVIAGQGTCAMEFMEQVKSLDIILAPIGGGGLISGTVLAAYHFSPKTQVIGAEPELANDAYRSFTSGILQKNDCTDTIADGLRLSLGDITFPLIQQYVERIIQVTEDEICYAMRLLWKELQTAIEPSSAVAYAAIQKEKAYFSQKRIGIIISGGNIERCL